MGHEVKVGEKISSQINIQEVHQLPKYYTGYEATGDESNNQMAKKYETVCSEINFDECIQNELTRQMITATEDKCLVPWFQHNIQLIRLEITQSAQKKKM